MLQRLKRVFWLGVAWLPKHRRTIAIGLGVFLLLLTGAQLVFPRDRILPAQRIGGQSTSTQTVSQLNPRLQEREKTTYIILMGKDREHPVAWRDAGVAIRTESTARAAANYPLWQRFIPLSSVYRVVFTDTPLQTEIKTEELNDFAEKMANKESRPAADATLIIKEGKVLRQSHKNGFTYDATNISRVIKEAQLDPHTRLTLETKTSNAAIEEADLEPAAKKADAILATSVSVKIVNDVIAVPTVEVGNWLQFKPTGETLNIDIDRSKVAAFIEGNGKKAYKAPGQTTIVLQDGLEVQRSPEQKGQAVHSEQGANVVASSLLGEKAGTVDIPLKELPPKYTYQRSYTKSTRGLNVLLADLTSTRPTMGIALQALDGSGIIASARGNKGFHPASTYKVLVAYEAYKRMEQGSLQAGDQINGRSVDQCIEVMIVNSDNACAEALAEKLGWQTLTNTARSLGMSGTNLAQRNNFTSTASDQTLLLAKLQSGQLLSPGNQGQLIDMMKRQKYREGIPKGTGVTVADKPGFTGAIIHDAAIVYGPKGPYVLTIYSSGNSWADVASVAKSIGELMNR